MTFCNVNQIEAANLQPPALLGNTLDVHDGCIKYAGLVSVTNQEQEKLVKH